MITLPIYTLEDLDGNKTQVGLIVTLFLIAAVIIRPFTGKLLDAFGKREMLYFSLGLYLAANLGYLIVGHFTTLLFLRAIHGIGFGIATIALGTIVADIIPKERRGEGMGYYSLFMNLAMVVGPFLGLTMIQFTSFNILFLVTSLFSLCAFISALVPKLPQKTTKAHVKTRLKLDDLFERKVLSITIMAGLLSFTYASLLSFLSLYAIELQMEKTASFFFVAYAVLLILSRPFTGRWFDQYGENVILYPAIFIYGLGMLLLSQTTHSFTFLLAGGLIGLGYGTIVPSIQTMAINNVAPHRRGIATGTFFTFLDTGIGTGSFILGIVAQLSGLRHLYLYSSIMVFLCIGIYYIVHGRKHKRVKNN